MSDKWSSKHEPGDITPNETKEIWWRVGLQLVHDRVDDKITIEPGLTDYLVRQIAFYKDQVVSERITDPRQQHTRDPRRQQPK